MEEAFHMASHERMETKQDLLLVGQSRLENRIVALEVRAGLIGSITGAIFGGFVGMLIK